MIVELMTCTDELNKVYKNPVLIDEYSCELKNKTSVVDPILLIADDLNAVNTNYCYIPEFGRYYYIVGIQSIKNGLWEVSCHCDVLYTYKAQLMELSGIVSRQSGSYNLMLSDPRVLHMADPVLQQKKFPRGFTDEGTSYILLLLGDSVSTQNE